MKGRTKSGNVKMNDRLLDKEVITLGNKLGQQIFKGICTNIFLYVKFALAES